MKITADSDHLCDEDRNRAIERGVDFLYHTACDPENFEAYGFDFVSCFYGIAVTAGQPALRTRARKVCLELARTWRSMHPRLPTEIDADDLSQFLIATDAADRIGLPDRTMRQQIRRAAKQFRAEDYFWFDPTREPPPDDVPDDCECGAANSRGNVVCDSCQEPLTVISRYEVWLLALIRTFRGDSYGVSLGARHTDVLRWLPHMRPYPRAESPSYADFIWSIYAVTHVIYTLNDYGVYQLSRDWLADEYEFLATQVEAVIEMDDVETVGEMLDALKTFDLSSKNRVIGLGEAFVLSRQHPDGSWGDLEAEDIYERYHPTITAIDGLRPHAWRPASLRSAHVRRLLEVALR